MNPQKPKTKIKNGESEEVPTEKSHELPHRPQEFRENLVDESTSEELRRDLMQRLQTLPVLLMNY